MNFVKRMKTDKGFRWKVILIFLVIVFLYGQTAKKTAKTQDECNVYNDEIWCNWNYLDSKIYGCNDLDHTATCESNGCFEGIEITNTNEEGCFAAAPGGIFVKSVDGCYSGVGLPQESGVTGYNILCKSGEPNPDNACGSELQSQLANMVSSIPGLGTLGCKLRFYLVAGGGGLIIFMMVMAMM